MKEPLSPGRYPFSITAEDIAGGKPRKCMSCPGALAVLRGFPGASFAVVSRAFVDVYTFGPDRGRPACLTARTPPELLAFMDAFDKRLPVGPLAFTLDFEARVAQADPMEASAK